MSLIWITGYINQSLLVRQFQNLSVFNAYLRNTFTDYIGQKYMHIL